MQYVIDIPTEHETIIEELVRNGRVANLRTFVRIAIENQIELESRATNAAASDKETVKAPRAAETRSRVDGVDAKSILAIPSLRPAVFQALQLQNPERHYLWGQYYRFLPIKLVLRVLANMTPNGPVRYASLVGPTTQAAIAIGERLRANDDQGGRPESIGAGFPTRVEASTERFRQQFIADYRPDKRPRGFPVELGLETVFEQDGAVKVGLTRAGAIFALLDNPVLDAGSREMPLAAQEQLFLIEHVRRTLPREFEIMLSILRVVKEDTATPAQLDGVARETYGEQARTWSGGHVTTMRAGLVSRMWELGLLTREWHGRQVRYHLTENGLALLSGEPSKFTDAYKALYGAYEVTA